MKITALHITRLANEFGADLTGAEVVNLRKSERDKTVAIHLVADEKKYSLVFRFGGDTSYFYLQHGHRPRIVTTNFLPQLLKYEIATVKQVGFDRIIQMGLARGEKIFKLIFELFGLSSNLYLTDEEQSIITSIRKSKLGLKKYQPPESPGLENPLDFETDSVVKKLMAHDQASLLESLLQTFSGLTEDMLRPLDDHIELSLDDPVSDFSKEELRGFLDIMVNACRNFVNPDTELYYDPEEESISLADESGQPHAARLSDILLIFSKSKRISKAEKSEKNRFLGIIKRSIRKENRKMEKLERQLEQAREYPQLQKKAELLSANLHMIKKGMSTVEVQDIYSEENGTIEIKVDKTLSPAKNMERLFAQARKYKEKIPGIKRELASTKKNLSSLEQLRSELEAVQTDKLPSDLKEKLEQSGITAPQKGEKQRKTGVEHLPYREFRTSRGETVLVGKSARDNDRLTFKVARKNDLWFHSQQTSGSHVILRRPNRAHEFQKASILEAAEIAAFYSPAKNSETVPVIYTEVKYVRKARKGDPGKVIAERTKSILVTPRRPKN